MDEQACLKDVICWHVDWVCFMYFCMCHFPTLHQSRVCYLFGMAVNPSWAICVCIASFLFNCSEQVHNVNLNAQSWRSISYYWQSYFSDRWSAPWNVPLWNVWGKMFYWVPFGHATFYCRLW
jgi:hypothetical protein